MKNFCHKTFRLTTSLASSGKSLQACNPQSALTPVRSVECGLFAYTPALGILCKELCFTCKPS